MRWLVKALLLVYEKKHKHSTNAQDISVHCWLHNSFSLVFISCGVHTHVLCFWGQFGTPLHVTVVASAHGMVFRPHPLRPFTGPSVRYYQVLAALQNRGIFTNIVSFLADSSGEFTYETIRLSIGCIFLHFWTPLDSLTMNYTLQSLKATLLSFGPQLAIWRHPTIGYNRGHHADPRKSLHSCGGDSVWGSLR